MAVFEPPARRSGRLLYPSPGDSGLWRFYRSGSHEEMVIRPNSPVSDRSKTLKSRIAEMPDPRMAWKR
jgi:hypothetical protein